MGHAGRMRLDPTASGMPATLQCGRAFVGAAFQGGRPISGAARCRSLSAVAAKILRGTQGAAEFESSARRVGDGMTIPLESGQTWEADPEGNFVGSGGMNRRVWLRDTNAHGIRAIFKSPPSSEPEAIYSIGMERVVFNLAEALRIPVPAVHLEPFGGVSGCVMSRVSDNARTFQQSEGKVMLDGIDDEAQWPLYATFDIWIANYDRDRRNLMLEPVPPETLPQRAIRCRTWLIDNGASGLWWPRKFDTNLTVEVDRVTVGDGSLTDEANERLREVMPARYRKSLTMLDTEDREQFLDSIRGVVRSRRP
jgi:hypothetical protein